MALYGIVFNLSISRILLLSSTLFLFFFFSASIYVGARALAGIWLAIGTRQVMVRIYRFRCARLSDRPGGGVHLGVEKGFAPVASLNHQALSDWSICVGNVGGECGWGMPE